MTKAESPPKPLSKKDQLAIHLRGLPGNSTGTLVELAEMLGCRPNTVKNALLEIGGNGDTVVIEGGRWTLIDPESLMTPGVISRSNVVLVADRFRQLNPANSAPGAATHSRGSGSSTHNSGGNG